MQNKSKRQPPPTTEGISTQRTGIPTYKVFLLLPLIVCAFHISAQTEERNPISIKLNPMGIFTSSIPLSIEQMLGGKTFSATLGGSVTQNKSGNGESTYNNTGFSLSPEFRYYFNHSTEVQSFTYTGAWINYEEHHNATKDRYGNLVAGDSFGRGIGILIGNQWFFKNKFLIDFFAGPGFMKYENSENYNLNITKGGFMTSLTGPKNTGTKIRVGLSVGLCF